MKHLFKLLTCFVLLVLISCQKELSEENPSPAQGTLQSNTSGECLPKIVGGTFITGKPLADTNYIEVELVVTTPGAYNMETNVVNGYSFKGSGNINSSGTHRIILKGTGTPLAAGTDLFTVNFDSTSCTIPVTVVQGIQTGTPGVYTLALGTGGSCMNASVSGSFIKNTALTSSNTVTIELNVTTAGTYSITTNTVNGYSFSGTGTVNGTGTQNVVLTATGTPANEGANTFTVTAGSSSCTFSVTVLPSGSTPPPNGDYFPLTVGSWWSYDDPFFAGDTLKFMNAGPATINSNTYQLFKEYDTDGQVVDTSYFRKSGNDYYNYAYTDAFTSLVFDAAQRVDILFLKQTLTTGATWTQGPYNGTLNGISQSIRYQFTCTNANASVTVNGKSFTNVYHITIKPEVSIMGAPYAATTEVIETFYAKGVGLIDTKMSIPGNPLYRTPIRNWVVN